MVRRRHSDKSGSPRSSKSGFEEIGEKHPSSDNPLSLQLQQQDTNVETLKKRLRESEQHREKLQRQLKYMAAAGTENMLATITTIRRQFSTSLDEVEEQVHSLQQQAKQEMTAMPNRPRRDRSPKSRKVFTPCDSGLNNEDATVMMRVVGIAVLIGVVVEIDSPSTVLDKMADMIFWGFGSIKDVSHFWFALFFQSLLIVPMFMAWKSRYIPTSLYVFSYVFLQIQQCLFGIWATSAHSSFNLELPCAAIIMCEQVRISMKMHAFFIETFRMSRSLSSISRQNTEGESSTHQRVRLLDQPYALFCHYVYFLFVPTLVYRNWYPKTHTINWFHAFSYLSQGALSIAVCSYIFAAREIKATWSNVPDLVSSIARSMVPGLVLLMVAFFGVLHFWLNGWGELTMFADRNFYSSWWTSRSYSQFYRRWNKVVGDWLRAYCYKDMMLMGVSRTHAFFFVFFVSGIVHEYIITQVTGFFYPVLLVLFMGAGVSFTFLNRLKKGAKGWNTFVWSTLFLGQGIVLELYATEFEARKYGSSHNIDPQSWKPYSWQLFGQKLTGPVAEE